MDPYTDLLNQQRQLTPPSGAIDRLERRVMARLDRLPAERRRRRLMLSGASLCGALILLVAIIALQPRVERVTPPDFIESVVFLGDHTCIWLERADVHPRNGLAHE